MKRDICEAYTRFGICKIIKKFFLISKKKVNSKINKGLSTVAYAKIQIKRNVVQIVHEKISIEELKIMAEKMFGDFVKAVVDIEKEIMAVDAELHADAEGLLLEHGSQQEHLWGINIYPEMENESLIELDSMINLRPSMGNRSRGVEDPVMRKKIRNIVNKLIIK